MLRHQRGQEQDGAGAAAAPKRLTATRSRSRSSSTRRAPAPCRVFVLASELHGARFSATSRHTLHVELRHCRTY